MSSALFRNNATVTGVQRRLGVDRYGKEQRGIVPGLIDFRVHLDRSSNRVIGLDGVAVTVDGVAMVAKRFKLQEGDLLEISDGSLWVIYNESEALDVTGGRVVHRIFNLTKQRTSA